MSKTDIEKRLAEIEQEEKKIAYDEYAHGIMPDRQYSAKLFQEKIRLMKELKAI